ncbi:hypothetical protein FA95DRAFT_1611025 [Auriscalpium vulgare]|uniref:Uncharacterized protein n=1 Tax=Auriscalpium vulgare TaxID=40419 RepID=A0ACB8RBH5_9AGAM|nr:hypothetical protein FA95DRAFT_1611025 [Auriscalpium vulgare]
MNPGIPALSEDKETSLSPIYPSTGAPWSPQHEWPADVFPVGTPFPEYPVAYPEAMAHVHVDPQAPRHTVAICGQAGCNSGSTVIPELQVAQGLGSNAVFIPETVQPYNTAIHHQPFDYTQNQPTEDFSAFLTANGISAPTTPHGQASYSLNTGTLAGVVPIWPEAPQLPSYQNHCHDAAPQNIHAQQLAIDPRLTYAPPQGQRRAATGMRAVRRTEPYPTSHVAATRAAHVNAMFTTAAMAQSFAAAAQHGGHDAFDTNSSLRFNNVQEQMIASLPRSVQISGNIARRRYSSASSGYLSSGSSHYPTTPTSDMPPGMPYGPVSVVSPTQHIPAAYNDWSIQMPSLAAPQPQVFMPTLYAMNEPFSGWQRRHYRIHP